MGSSRKDLSAFPDQVKQDVGHALFVAQEGGRAPKVKTLQGFGGSGVVEIVDDHDGDTFRCVYTTRINDVIVVLHAFQKKSRRGSETARHDVELIRMRMKTAQAMEWS